MSRVDYFHVETGMYSGVRYDGPDEDAEANAPAGCVAVAALDEPHAKRLVDGEFVDHTTAPAVDTWSVRQSILALEGKQARADREFRLGLMDEAEYLQRLQTIDDAITTLRADLSAGS